MIQTFEGKKPKIAKSAFIHQGAYIIGDVEIGKKSNVWPGAVIRADFGKIVIGNNVAIEDNCVIHCGTRNPDLIQDLEIGDNVMFGHGAVINGRKIGRSVLIGINATVLFDVEIGDFCIIGAGSMVGEGMKIPSGSFIAGVPAKIKGEITPKQMSWLKSAPKRYVEIAARHRKDSLILEYK
jgi:carbonic anhydrase/acetyltransferase-like protein (isoleucine patch superfamily)